MPAKAAQNLTSSSDIFRGKQLYYRYMASSTTEKISNNYTLPGRGVKRKHHAVTLTDIQTHKPGRRNTPA